MKISKASGRKISVSCELHTISPGGRDAYWEFKNGSLKETILQHSMTTFAFHLEIFCKPQLQSNTFLGRNTSFLS